MTKQTDLPVRAEVKTAKPRESDMIAIREEENQLFADATAVVRDAIQFYDLGFDEEEVPEEWIKALGEEEAVKRFRRVKAGQKSAKEAPIGVKVAMSVATSIIKARGNERSGPKLNVNVAIFPSLEEYPQYDEIPVKDD